MRWGWALLGVCCVMGCRTRGSEPVAITPVSSVQPPGPTPSTSATPPATEKPREAFAAFLHTKAGNDAPFGEPNAWVYVPTGFDPKAPLRLVVFFHGFSNCLRSFVAAEGVPCRQFQPPRTAYSLPAQIERAGLGSIAIVPQLAFDRRSSDPLKLRDKGAMKALVREVLEEHLGPLGKRSLDEVVDVTFVAASGGSEALGPALTNGGLGVTRVILMDAYYAASLDLQKFAFDEVDHFAKERRLAVVYSDSEPTLGPTTGFADELAFHLNAKASPALLFHEKVAREVQPDDFRAPISFVHSKLGHDEIMRFDLWKALTAVAR